MIPAFYVSTDAIDPADQTFDRRYTCDSDNSSPEVRWNDPPAGTDEFALIMDDPDSLHGTFIHWVVYRIPGSVRHLPAGIPPQELLPNGIRQGLNAARKLGYFGPCPPPGDLPHRYRLTLYALQGPVDLDSRLDGEQLLDKVLSRTVATAQVTGTYARHARRAG